MGLLYASSLCASRQYIYAVAYATSTINTDIPEKGGDTPVLLVLVRSQAYPTDPMNITWSVVSTIPTNQDWPFRMATPLVLENPGQATCVADDNGIVSLSIHSTSLHTLQYDPKASRLTNSNTTSEYDNGFGEWSLLDSLWIRSNPTIQYTTFSMKDSINGSDTLYHSHFVDQNMEGRLSPSYVEFHLGKLQKNSQTILDSQRFVMNNIQGSMRRLEYASSKLYALIDKAPGYSIQDEPDIYFNKTLALIPAGLPLNLTNPLAPKTWDIPCISSSPRETIAASGDYFFYLCHVGNIPRTVNGYSSGEVSLTPILSHITGQPLFGLILGRNSINAIDLTGSDAQSTMALNLTKIPIISVSDELETPYDLHEHRHQCSEACTFQKGLNIIFASVVASLGLICYICVFKVYWRRRRRNERERAALNTEAGNECAVSNSVALVAVGGSGEISRASRGVQEERVLLTDAEEDQRIREPSEAPASTVTTTHETAQEENPNLLKAMHA
ncbi:hypothetical protein BGZ51_005233 [Haplosporangium sp. Z 767]|nr:hypothetical protein BGZ51_005233 [Haplosporangium sp. Z 767]